MSAERKKGRSLNIAGQKGAVIWGRRSFEVFLPLLRDPYQLRYTGQEESEENNVEVTISRSFRCLRIISAPLNKAV